MRVPPWPVTVAAGIFAMLTLAVLATVIFLFTADAVPVAVALLVVVALLALTANGLWHGHRGARVVACLIAIVIAVSGLQRLGVGDSIGLLLLVVGGFTAAAITVPRASRNWFAVPDVRL